MTAGAARFVALLAVGAACGPTTPHGSAVETETGAETVTGGGGPTDEGSAGTTWDEASDVPPPLECVDQFPLDEGAGWSSFPGYALLPGETWLLSVHGIPGDATGDGRADVFGRLVRRRELPSLEPPRGFFVVPGKESETPLTVDDIVKGVGGTIYVDSNGEVGPVSGPTSGLVDQDLDGFEDMLVTVWSAGGDWNPVGQYVLWGPLEGPEIRVEDAELEGRATHIEPVPEYPSLSFGAVLGDVTGDGIPDFGAAGHNLDETFVLVVPGTGDRTAPLIQAALDGGLGIRVDGTAHVLTRLIRAVGDLDGDGLQDFMTEVELGPFNHPHLIVYGTGDTVRFTTESVPRGQGFIVSTGGGIAGRVGDINGDGFDDYLFGSSDSESGSPVESLLYGGPRSFDSVSAQDVGRSVPGVHLSLTTYPPGMDVDGDGFFDLLIWDPPWVWVLNGASDLPDSIGSDDLRCGKVRAVRLPSRFPLDGLAPVAPPQAPKVLADFNGDGLADVSVQGRHDEFGNLGSYIFFAQGGQPSPRNPGTR